MKLHFHPISSNVWKCVAVAHETGLPVELAQLDFMARTHKSPEYLARNPNGKVPMLEDGDFSVWESNAICCYIAAKAPEKGLLPLDPKGIGEVQQWLQWQATTVSTSVGKVMGETFYAKAFGRQTDEANLKKGYEETAGVLAILDKVLGDGREFLCGRLTVADFSIASNFFLRNKVGIDTSAFKNVESWLARIESRESVKKTIPQL